jgi:hypothetical protein
MVVDGKQERERTRCSTEKKGEKGLTEKNTERNTSVGQSVYLGLSDFGSGCMKNEKKKREKDLFDVLR